MSNTLKSFYIFISINFLKFELVLLTHFISSLFEEDLGQNNVPKRDIFP